MSHDEVWKVHAACREASPDWWYPESSASPVRAVRVCATCPVRVDCLRFALVGVEVFGTWGGASERVRRHLRALWQRSSHPDRVVGPEGCVCSFCRALVRHEHRLQEVLAGEHADAPLNTNGPGAVHGKAVTYARGCRCEPCLVALREARREGRERRRAAAADQGQVA